MLDALRLPEAPGASLAQKEAAALAAIDQAFAAAGPGGLAVAWTGGKDSTLVLALVRERLAALAPWERVRAVSVDTGCKFPEIVAFRDRLAREWDLDLTIARPGVDLASYPLAVDKVSCCRDLKIRPLARALDEMGVAVLLTGLRADEHPSRASRPPAEAVDEPPHVRVHPILRFTEMDVWAYHADRDLPHCGLYAQGYRSLGCVPCTAKVAGPGPERAGRDADKEAKLETLRSLGYF
ncbi:phosphoadenosine phosphosulfate reductase family protein [Desulfocurvus sp. DL9XJH121]